MPLPAHAAGTFSIADRTVHRLGYGAMRITGPGVWGWPADRDEAIRVLRLAVELGVDFIDTADSYGPTISEELIFAALHPYGDVFVATKAGLLRTGPGRWYPCGRPEYLRQQCELSLRRLGVEALDLLQLHRIDPTVDRDEQFGLLAALLEEGKVRAVGLSEVTAAELAAAREVVDIATVQNHYNVVERRSDGVLDACEAARIGFIAYFPVAAGELTWAGAAVAAVAQALDATPAQVSLAWLLQRGDVVLPIPGTSSVAHLEENCAAAELRLPADQLQVLDALAGAG
ncbi:MAG TPA: aldo/keto reductase [Acidimicrobiales bacterium]|nr:aldo/keto reductase [Acidimicrobiales bacterium]